MLRDLQVTGTPGWFACQAANGNDAWKTPPVRSKASRPLGDVSD